MNDIKKRLKRYGKKRNSPVRFLTKSGAIHGHLRNAIGRCHWSGNKIYPFEWSRSGGYCNLNDQSGYVTVTLEALGYKYKWGNDAPRGGKDGSYIKVSKRAKEVLLSLVEGDK